MQDTLLILNFDNACASTLAKKLRAERINCLIIPGDTPFEELIKQEALGLVLAGGVTGDLTPGFDRRLLTCELPLLCMGDTALAMASLLESELSQKQQLREVVTVSFLPSPLTNDLTQSERYIHTLRHIELSEGLHPVATARDQVIGFAHDERSVFGFGFQVESNDPDGVSILLHFAKDICCCTPGYSEGEFINSTRLEIEEATGDGMALCVLTGSLESGVAAMLAHRALGERLHCLVIDTCFMRENELDDLLYFYRDSQGMNIHLIDAKDRFCEALIGITDPKRKYETISGLYDLVLKEASQSIPHDVIIRPICASDLLLKTNLYPMPFLSGEQPVLEPLRELFIEEIRNIAESLNMPQEQYLAQPFPGTGLALRVLGEVSRKKLAILRKADAIFREEIKKANLIKRLYKYYVTLLQMENGTEGISLSVVLRAVTLMTSAGEIRATPARLPYDLLEQYTARTLLALPEVNQIVNDITPGNSKPE